MYTQTDVTNHAKETGHSNYRGYQYQEESGEYQTVIWDYETSTETYTVTEAYDEKVIDHYECSCGATK
jgi:hypothetical protein